MKKISTLLTYLTLTAAFVQPTQTKAQSCPWAKKAGGTNEELGVSVATDASGNVYYLGNFYSQTISVTGTGTLTVNLSNQPYQASNYGAELYLAKYDSCGALKWAKKAGGKDETYGTAVAADATGNVYITGFAQSDTTFFGSSYILNSNYRDVFVAKYNTSGVVQWVTSAAGNDNDFSEAITVDGAGNIYVTGEFVSRALIFGTDSVTNGTNDGYTRDVFIAKLDNTGAPLWIRGSSSNSFTSDAAYGYGISTDGGGNVYVGGKFNCSAIRFGTDSLAVNGNSDMYLVKYDGSGNEVWLRSAGGSDNDGINAIATDAAGNTYVTGYIGGSSTVTIGSFTLTNTAINRTVFIAKYDASGTPLWAHVSNGDHWSDNTSSAISLDGAGNAYISGSFSSDSLKFGPATIYNTSYTNGSGGGDYFYDVFAAKYKSNGAIQWARAAGGDSSDFCYGMASGPHNALYLTGEFRSPVFSVAGINLNLAASSISGDGDAFICNNISTLPITPDICLVSADTMWGGKEYNVIYWDKTPYTTVSEFVVLREVTSGVYKPIGHVPYSALSMFIDTTRSVGPANGDPLIGTYRYKIQLMDTASSFSFMSPYHNTVFFQNNSGTFNWNLYTVESMTLTPVTQFDLVRDDNATGAWHILSSIAGTQTSQTDPQYSTYATTADWRVEAQGFNCTPTFRLGQNSNQAAIIKSKSNITNNRGIGVEKYNQASAISIYPNPAKGNFVLETSVSEKQQMQIIDVNGKVVLSSTISGTTTVDVSSLSEGVYTVMLINSKRVSQNRLAIVK